MQNPWQQFFKEKITTLLTECKNVVDIGGGLRIDKEKNNRHDPSRAWIQPLLKNVDYKILDPVPDYHPDILGDIHDLPFADNSQEALICIAVLEHVKNPFKAVDEMYRVLKPGGFCFTYVPFLYYYHPMKGYYDDYWRFTNNGIDELFKHFSTVEKCNVRGAIETWFYLSPLGKIKTLHFLAAWLDKLAHKTSSKQTSGYNIFAIK